MMAKKTAIRNLLLEKGFFPEVLPPCFDSEDLTRCFKGMIRGIENRKFHTKSAAYIRYSGTKHDGNRRNYGTVHPVPYFSGCSFVSSNWKMFENKFSESSLSLESIRLGKESEDRAVVVPTLSELTEKMSSQVRYSPYILKTDIAQFFPSIYTHSISWAAHTVEVAKANTSRDSPVAYFNQLDWYTQQCQSRQTRGVVVGPDLFRIFAEYISCSIDKELQVRAGSHIVGGVRHVDDFYIGVRTEVDATVVLSHLRDILQNYELQINDAKTKILCGLDSVDDVWAQDLRAINMGAFHSENFGYALDKAHDYAKKTGSQSPVKLVLRRLDVSRSYLNDSWETLESKLQRVLFHYSHCTDYVCLLLAKRFAIGRDVDIDSWSEAINLLLDRNVRFNHHHEISWLLWIAMVCRLKLNANVVTTLSSIRNSHIKALLIAGFVKGKLDVDPKIRLGAKLSTTDTNWLHNLVGRSLNYSSAPFSGEYKLEFEHLANKRVNLIDFDKHIRQMSESGTVAISSSKYGYDSEDENEDEDFDWEDFDRDDFEPF